MTVTAALAGWRAWGAVLASTTLIIWASREYVAACARREADPRLASWIIWTCSMGIGAAAAMAQGKTAAAALGAAGAASCVAVLAAGARHGNRETGWLDASGAACAGAGLLLLTEAALRPRAMPMQAAVTASVVTDLAAFAPTLLNAWRGEETAAPYVTYGLAAAVTLTAADGSPASLTYPAYEIAACALAAWLAAARRETAPYDKATGRALREILARTWAMPAGPCQAAPGPQPHREPAAAPGQLHYAEVHHLARQFGFQRRGMT